jgi:hypothetical protein
MFSIEKNGKVYYNRKAFLEVKVGHLKDRLRITIIFYPSTGFLLNCKGMEHQVPSQG